MKKIEMRRATGRTHGRLRRGNVIAVKILLLIGLVFSASHGLAQDNIERTDNFPTGYIKGTYPYNFGTVDGVLYVFLGSYPGILVKFPPGDSRESFTIPNTVSRIAKGAFKGCVNLKEVIIPGSVFYIAEDAFDDSGIERFEVAGNDVVTHVNPVETGSPLPDGYYDLAGRALDGAPAGPGVIVERGKATKVLK